MKNIFILSFMLLFTQCKRAHYYCYCEGGGKKSAIVDNYGTRSNKRSYEKICDKHLDEGYTDCKLVE